jgi:hypothetical protein
MPSKAIAGGIAVVGLAIMIGCAVPMSKEKDKNSSKYKGLIAGVVIGVLMIVAGIAMFFMGGGGGASLNSPDGGASLPSENVGSKTVAETSSPLNAIEAQTHKTELNAALNAKKANNLAAHAKNALEKTAQLKGVISLFKG